MKKFLLTVLSLFVFVSFAKADDGKELMLSSTHAYYSVMNEYIGVETLLAKSKAILIFPTVKKIGFIVGGMYGKGVALIKKNGEFIPYTVTLTNGSIGFQIGYEDNSLIFYVLSDKILNSMLGSDFSLGGDVTATVAGASASLGNMDVFTKDIYAFTNKSGVFVGVSLGGGVISIDQNNGLDMNSAPYKSLVNVVTETH